MSGKSEPGATVVPLDRKRKVRPCPICRKPAVHEFRPFCSKRCADIDLGRWLTEDYRVPADDAPDPYEDE